MTHAAASNAFPAPEHDHDRCLAEAMERAQAGVHQQRPQAHTPAPVGVPGDCGLAQGNWRLRGARQARRQGRAAGADLGLPGNRCAGRGRHRAPLREPQRLLCLPCRPRHAPARAGLRDLRPRGRGRRRQGVRGHRYRGCLGGVLGHGCGGRGAGPVRRPAAPRSAASGGSRRMDGHDAQGGVAHRTDRQLAHKAITITTATASTTTTIIITPGLAPSRRPRTTPTP